jgi:hypothetical protein
VSTETNRLSAKRSHGGLQFTGLTPGYVAQVARTLQALLLGGTDASTLARDQLQQAQEMHPKEVGGRTGIVCNAMRYLAGYGIYLTVATDRHVGRMVDEIG